MRFKTDHVINTSPTVEGNVQVYDAADWTGAQRWKDEDVWIADVPPDTLGAILGCEFGTAGKSASWYRSFRVGEAAYLKIKDANVGVRGLFR